jgi:hypothetical protein
VKPREGMRVTGRDCRMLGTCRRDRELWVRKEGILRMDLVGGLRGEVGSSEVRREDDSPEDLEGK